MFNPRELSYQFLGQLILQSIGLFLGFFGIFLGLFSMVLFFVLCYDFSDYYVQDCFLLDCFVQTRKV